MNQTQGSIIPCTPHQSVWVCSHTAGRFYGNHFLTASEGSASLMKLSMEFLVSTPPRSLMVVYPYSADDNKVICPLCDNGVRGGGGRVRLVVLTLTPHVCDVLTLNMWAGHCHLNQTITPNSFIRNILVFHNRTQNLQYVFH